MTKLKDSQEENLIRALQREWNSIAGDCFVDENGRLDESIVMKGEDVRDIIADRFFGGGFFGEEWMKKAGEYYASLSWRQRRRAMKKAFPNKEYCW